MTSSPRALVAGGGAARALGSGGTGRLELSFGAGGYVRLGADRWLSLQGPRSARGPLSLVVAGLGAERPRPGSDVRVEDGALVVGATRIELGGVRTLGPPAWSPQAEDAGGAVAAAAAQCAAAPHELRAGLTALERFELSRAVGLLAGRGEGLTAAGDDVLAGYAGWFSASGTPVRLAATAVGRSSPIGLAYLRCAERGELPDAATAVLVALRAGDAALAVQRARVLGRWGHSSGSALMWGMAAGWMACVAALAFRCSPLGPPCPFAADG